MPAPNARGFTLLELLITLAIAVAVAVIALPSYQASVTRAHRTDALVALALAAQMLERYYTEHGSYTGATLGANGIYPSTSTNGYYTLSLTVDRSVALPTGASYQLQAAPTGVQAKDSQCGTYGLDETGFKTAAGGASDYATLSVCWAGS